MASRCARAMASWASWRVAFLLTHPMARRRRLAVLSTAARWEIMRRRSPRDVAVSLPGGGVLVCPPWTGSSRGPLSIGLEDFPEQTFLLDALAPGDVALDVGAHLGTYSVLMASRGATLHAFEPAPEARAALASTLARNAFTQPVEIHAVALSDFTGHANFALGSDSGNHLSASDTDTSEAETIEVEVDTLDNWATTHDLASLFVLKIDAEGADENVLRGASGVLARCEPVVMVEYWKDPSALKGLLANYGYETYRYDPHERVLVPSQDVSGSDGNLIACTTKRRDDVQGRLDTTGGTTLTSPRVLWEKA